MMTPSANEEKDINVKVVKWKYFDPSNPANTEHSDNLSLKVRYGFVNW